MTETEVHTNGGTVVASPEGWWLVTPASYHESKRQLTTKIGTERIVEVDKVAARPVCLWLINDGEMTPMIPSDDGPYLVAHDPEELPMAHLVHSMSGPVGARKAARSFYPDWADAILAELNEGDDQ